MKFKSYSFAYILTMIVILSHSSYGQNSPGRTAKAIHDFRNDRTPYHICFITLGSEKKSVRLSKVVVGSAGFPSRAFTRIKVSHGKKYFLLQRLDQLVGLVNIKSKQDALRLVRLRTSPASWLYWPRGESELEIVSERDTAQLPNYGIEDYKNFSFDGGRYGVFSQEAYKYAKFTPAQVEAVQSGYVIVRWIMYLRWNVPGKTVAKNGSEDFKVLKIREFVGADGSYKRTTLMRRHVNDLPSPKRIFPSIM